MAGISNNIGWFAFILAYFTGYTNIATLGYVGQFTGMSQVTIVKQFDKAGPREALFLLEKT